MNNQQSRMTLYKSRRKTQTIDKQLVQQPYRDCRKFTPEMDFWQRVLPSMGSTKVVLTSIQQCTLYYSHYPRLASHLNEGRMYDSGVREYTFIHLEKEKDVFKTVRNCGKCPWNRPANKNRHTTTIYIECLIGICRDGHSGTTPKELEWCPSQCFYK